MAAILAIVASFLGPAIQLGKCITEPIKRQFNYLCCFNNNVQNLTAEAKKLEDARADLQTRVDTEENNAQVVDSRVETWLEDVSEIQQKIPGIDEEITNTRNGGSTVRSRFSLSKKVKKTADAIKELRQSCNFNAVAHPPPPAAMVPIPLESTLEFQSRKQMEEEIMASLRDKEANMLGICGMGGVGKTTMAKRIMHRAIEVGFEETVMAVVGQTVDMLRIQGDIAKSLGLKSGEGSLSSKAHDLRTRLSAGRKRSLIVLDDVWDKLKLEDLGIPCHSGCKILVTSRDSDVIKRMSVEKVHVHAVKVLNETEAWDLFKSKAGSCIDHENVISVAQQVVKECNGLPIALVTVGVALKDVVNKSHWNAALHQLKSSNPRLMPEVLEDVYKPLRFSYECLKSVEEKSLFLLCCLFPQDYNIRLENLAIYVMGLRMSEAITSLEVARETVSYLVERLKNRFLLLEGYDEDYVKMHDVVRDVAIFIASEEKRMNCNDCTWISPNIGERIGGSIFSNLHLLWIGRESRVKVLEMQDDFFKGMRELNVLSIKYRSLQQLPHTTELLKNLRTLVLDSCGSLESISVVGELVNLEILICRWCKSIESLPIEMGKLSGLRLLELSHCENLKTIAPGIISNQKGLEELIVEEFDGWEADNEEGERKNASLSEINGLPRLTRLKIKIKDSRLGAEQMRLSPNIVKYDITIGNDVRRYHQEGFEKKIVVELPVNITLGNWIHECVRSVEYFDVSGDVSGNLDFGPAQNVLRLTLRKCSTVKKLVSMTTTVFPLLEVLKLENLRELVEICDSDGPMQFNSFNNLKKLILWNLPALEHLWKTSITPYDQHNVVSIFNKLSSICIWSCDKLCSLFSWSMMTRGSCLVQLERLEIKFCGMMEQVVLWDEEVNQRNNTPITLVFPKLKYLELKFLPRLTSFSKGIESIEFPQLKKLTVKKCPVLKSIVLTPDDDDSIHLFCKLDKVKFGCLKVVELEVPEYDEMRRNCCPQIPIDFFGGLCKLKVSGFKGLKSLFSLSVTESGCLLPLEKLEIIKCDMIEQVLLRNEEENQTDIDITQLFPKLKLLTLSHLPSLTSFCKGIQGIGFPLLENLKIYKYPLLKSFVSTASPDDHDDGLLFCKPDKVIFGCLKILTLHGNEMMANLCPFDALFAELRELKVSKFESMKSLLSLSTTTTSGCLSQLEKLEIESCNMMEQVVFLRNEEENQRSIHIPLIFPKLKFLTLESLPRLASFSKGIKSAEFPLLEKIKVRDCPLLKSFVSTGSTDDHDDGDDDSIHLFCQLGKVKFGCLSKMEVHDMMRRNWCPQIPFHFFAGLCEIKVSGFKGLKSLFSLSTTQSGCVLQLEKLEIIKCDMMEQVIFWKEEENQTDIDIITRLVFPKLKLLSLYHLPRLTSLSKLGIQSIQFLLPPQMNIWNCPLLESCVPTTHHNADADADADADDNDDSILLFCKPNKAETNDLPTSSRLIYV